MNHHHYLHPDPETLGLLRAMNRKLDSVISNQETIMASIDNLRADIGILIDTYTQAIADAVAKAQAASNDPAIDALDQTVKAATAALTAGATAPAVAVPVSPPDATSTGSST